MQSGIFFSIANYTILSYCIIYVSSYSLRSLKKQMKEKKKYIDSNKHPYLGHGYGLSAIRFLRRVTRRMMLILPGTLVRPCFFVQFMLLNLLLSTQYIVDHYLSLFWPLYCLSLGFLHLITCLVSSNLFCNNISAIFLKSALLLK